MSDSAHRPTEPWLDLAVRLQALAQAGLFFARDPFDRERYAEIREIATDMMALHTDTGADAEADTGADAVYPDAGYPDAVYPDAVYPDAGCPAAGQSGQCSGGATSRSGGALSGKAGGGLGETRRTLAELFCAERGYQTPKIDTRGVVFNAEGRVLLVQEAADGRWALPGGYVDIDQTLMGNTAKEVREEAGYTVIPKRLILVQDRRFREAPLALSISRFFFECELVGGRFEPNPETLDCGFFALDSLPPLCTRKTSREQIEICFEAHRQPDWEPRFLL